MIRSATATSVLLVGFATALGSLLPTRAAAQSTVGDSAAVPDTVPRFAVDPLVVTVSRLPVRSDRAGFSVSVLVPEVLEREHPTYAVEALRELPGVFVDESVGPGGPTIVRLRGGEEVFTQILMDGVQVNENGGFFDFQGVPLSNMERVEVARGPQSALYGSSAVSGVVQMVTRSGEPGPARLSGTVEGGGGTGEGRSFRGSGAVRGGSSALLYSAGAGVAWNRGIHDIAHDTRTLHGSLRLDGRPADAWALTGVARFIGVDSNHPVRDAGATRVPLDPNAELERDRLVLTGAVRHDPSTRWSHTLRTSFFRQDFRFSDERDDITPPEGVFVTDATYDFNADLWRGTAEYVGRWASADDPVDAGLAVAFGAQAEREVLDQVLTGDFGDSETSLDRNSVAGFVDLRSTPHPRLTVLVGARLETYEGLDAEVTPRGSLAWEAAPERLTLRAAAGRAYKVPNLMEQFTDNAFLLANPDLAAETSVSWEVGADVHVGPRLTVSATGFLQEYDNLIRTVAVEGDERNQNRNIGESRAWGVEGTAGYRFSPQARGELSFTRSWTEIVDNTGLPPEQYPEGEELPFRAGTMLSGLLQARLGSRVEVVGRVTRVGSQIVLENRFSGPRTELDGYLRVDATVDVAVEERTTVYLRVENLFDESYETAFDRPGIPPTAVLGVRVH